MNIDFFTEWASEQLRVAIEMLQETPADYDYIYSWLEDKLALKALDDLEEDEAEEVMDFVDSILEEFEEAFEIGG